MSRYLATALLLLVVAPLDACAGDTALNCDDGVRNGDETATDCGGGCGGCMGARCTQADECASGMCNGRVCVSAACTIAPCQHGGVCTAPGGARSCACVGGWKGENCEVPDGCFAAPCGVGTCVDDGGGGYSCDCPTGAFNSGTSCAPCAVIAHCDAVVCTSTTDASCATCSASYELDGAGGCKISTRCIPNPCGAGSCTDSGNSSYDCDCPAGAYDDGETCAACAPVDNCLVATCTDAVNSVCTTCAAGWGVDGAGGCRDVDDCAGAPCGPGSCRDTGTNAYACTCGAGTYDDGKTCASCDGAFGCDVVTCTSQSDETCLDCSDGYTDDGSGACEDINGCAGEPCGGGTCADEIVGYSCSCPGGQFDDGATCRACTALAGCGALTCTNGGDSSCVTCSSGFVPSGLGGCTDKNDCTPNPCGGGSCTDKGPNAYDCTCAAGEFDDGTTCRACAAIAHCTAVTCSSTTRETCTACTSGFVPNGAGGCADKDDCAPNPCGGNACSDTGTNSYACTCQAGQYFNGTTCVACSAIASCTSGLSCTNASDSTCGQCDANSFGPGCTALTTCTTSEYQSSAPTASSDRVCTALTKCAANQYESSAPTASSDRVCTALTTCRPSQYQSAAPTANSDRVCTALTTCLDSEYESTAPTTTRNRVCTPRTLCTISQYESVRPTTTSDRVCVNFTICTVNQYESTAPTATSDRICSAPTTCTASQYESSAPTPTRDRICTAITTCTGSQYQSVAPTATSDRICPELTICTAGQYESTAPTATSDRACTECTAITNCDAVTCTTADNEICATCSTNFESDGAGGCQATIVCTPGPVGTETSHPIEDPQFSAPAIESVPPMINFSDDFVMPYAAQWESPTPNMIDQPAAPPRPHVIITSDYLVPGPGNVATANGLRSRATFPKQAFSLVLNVEVLESESTGDYCVGVIVDTMAIGYCHFEAESGYDVPILRYIDSQGAEQFAEAHRTAASGDPITLRMSYDGTSQLTGSLSGGIESGPLQICGAPMSDTSRVLLVVTSERGDGAPIVEAAQGSAAFVDVITTLDADSTYAATLAPFEDQAGIDYHEGRTYTPATFFQPVLDTGTSVEILSDETLIPADGRTNLNIALVTTTPEGGPANTAIMATLITPLSEDEILMNDDIASVDDFIPRYFCAEGLGYDYRRSEPEVCDGVDNDCDGITDNGHPGETVGPSPGRIFLSSTDIRGWQGRVLVAVGPGGRGRVCQPIDADPFMLPVTALSDIPADDPCGSAATADTLFEPGNALVTVSVLTPGFEPPEATTAVKAMVVDGDVWLEIDGPALAPGTAPGQPGTVTVSSSEILGQSDKVLVVFWSEGLARLCAEIDADPFTLGATVMNALAGDNNPCTDPGADDEVTFQPGIHMLMAGIFRKGQQQPDDWIEVPIRVDGDTAVMLDGLALSGYQVNADDGYSCEQICAPGYESDGAGGCQEKIQVSAGFLHTCGLRGNGALFCWGQNEFGQLGDGTTEPRSTPTQVGSATDWTSVAAGGNQTCGVRAPGDLYCWGKNDFGQLGDATTTQHTAPTRVGTASDWSSVAVGNDHACGVRDESLFCWGRNQFGKLGDNSTSDHSSPAEVKDTTGIGTYYWSSVTAGAFHTCGVTIDGTLFCWGYNGAGQLGVGNYVPTPHFTPTQVGNKNDWTNIAAGGHHTCGVRAEAGDRRLYCWGDGSHGNLGIGDGGGQAHSTPQVVEGTNWASVVAGSDVGGFKYTTCGVRAGALYCWGSNDVGQLGDGTTTERTLPTRVGLETKWASVATSGYHTCGARAGVVYCWGSNGAGQLGDGIKRTKPTRVGAETDWASVSAGSTHTCGVRADGALYCWGDNVSGQLGDNTSTKRSRPTQVGTGTNWASVAAGNLHTCGVTTGDALFCWGDNTDSDGQHGSGRLGDGTTENRSTPTPVMDPADSPETTQWASVAAVEYHTCGVTAGGALYCWGDNDAGQLGDNLWPDNQSTPSPVVGPPSVPSTEAWASVAAGGYHTCGVTDHGALYCWGFFAFGQLGEGSVALVYPGDPHPLKETPTLPVAVKDVDPPVLWRSVAAGVQHTCGVTDDGILYCWGLNSFGPYGYPGFGGWLGDGTLVNSSTPTAVVSTVDLEETHWASVTAGQGHTCGITEDDGRLFCWGLNVAGGLGVSVCTTLQSTTPTQVGVGTEIETGWASVDAGRVHTCGVRAGALYCWGDNEHNQLGIGDTWTPTPVAFCP